MIKMTKYTRKLRKQRLLEENKKKEIEYLNNIDPDTHLGQSILPLCDEFILLDDEIKNNKNNKEQSFFMKLYHYFWV